jgi:hypothetical protein
MGQKLEELAPHSLTVEAQIGLNEVQGMLNTGGVPPVLMGNAAGTNTVGGLNILSHQAMTIVKPRNKLVEDAFSWLAKELVQQYVDGEYEGIHFEGLDGRNHEYAVDIAKEKLVTDAPIKAENKLNLPQDEMTMAGVVGAMTEANVWSQQRAMDKMGVEDPDAEKQIIAREKGEAAMPLALYALRDGLIKDDPKNPHIWVVQKAIQQMEQQAMQNVAGATTQPGVPNVSGVVPKPGLPVTNKGMSPQLNDQTMTNEDMRLERMGMTRGR